MLTGEVEDGSSCKSGFIEGGAEASFDRGHRCQRCARDDASTGSGDPVILLNRFRGTLDTWDPAFVAALARRHRVVMFDSLGSVKREATRRQRSKLLPTSRPA